MYSQAKIIIGSRSVISQKVYLCTGTHDYTTKGMQLVCKPIFIGSNVWVAADGFVHPGVSIAEGCVIGARAVVLKNMPPWMVCVGHPCEPVKERIRFE